MRKVSSRRENLLDTRCEEHWLSERVDFYWSSHTHFSFLSNFSDVYLLFTAAFSQLLGRCAQTGLSFIAASFFLSLVRREEESETRYFISFMYENANHHAEKGAAMSAAYKRLRLVDAGAVSL
jgi:hypothetical protein